MDAEVLRPLYDSLHRYAGWLDRERAAAMVRSDILALGTAIDACADPTPLLQVLDTNLARLPGGEVRKMLRATSAKMRRVVTGQP